MHAEKRQTHLSRRELLVGSAALAGAAALSHPIFAFARGVGAGDIDSAAPRGKQRNLLSKSCSPEKLKEVLIPQSKYRPYPTIHDRAAWEGLRAETRSNLLAGGE